MPSAFDRSPRLAAAISVALLAVAAPANADPPFAFEDVTEPAGVMEHIRGVRAHAAAVGDITGNGYPDYFLGTFWLPGTTHNRLLINNADGTFTRSAQPPIEQVGRATGAILADLNNNGRLDLYISHHTRDNDSAHQNALNRLFRNDGDGRFTEVSDASGAIPRDYSSRDVIPLDYDGDGRLDLLIGGGPWGGDDSGTPGLRLLRNVGEMRFEDVSEAAGLPVEYRGSSGAVGDVSGNGYPDIFFAGSRANRLLLNDGNGRFYEAPGTAEVFRAAIARGGQSPTGVAMADLTGNGRLDIIVGQHTKRPWVDPVAPRIYLNTGNNGDGHPQFIDATDAAGIEPAPMKTPHIEVQDFNNNGRPDIFFSVIAFDTAGRPHPLIYENLGVRDGVPRFRQHALSVNDFPTREDREMRGSTARFYDKMNADRKITYAVAAPAADFDRDGRIDLLVGEWWAENPSMLLRNVTPTDHHYLQVAVEGRAGRADRDDSDGPAVNRMGIGSKVYLYEPGELGNDDALIAMREITIGHGYSTSQEAIAHFGLGDREHVDLRVVLPHGAGTIDHPAVAANQLLTIVQP